MEIRLLGFDDGMPVLTIEDEGVRRAWKLAGGSFLFVGFGDVGVFIGDQLASMETLLGVDTANAAVIDTDHSRCFDNVPVVI